MATPSDNLNAAFPAANTGDIVQDLVTGEYWQKEGSIWIQKSTTDQIYTDLSIILSPFDQTLTYNKSVSIGSDVRAFPYDIAAQINTVDLTVSTGGTASPITVRAFVPGDAFATISAPIDHTVLLLSLIHI